VAALGRAGAEVLGLERFAVGRDTRASGPELSMALHHGIAAAGGSSLDLGVLPTPAVALWAAEHNVGAAMVSASHNPWHDNGVKFFAPGGLKLTDADQDQVQARFDELVADHTPEPTDVAVSDGHERARQAHVDALVNSLSGRRLDGLTVVLDTAHGAAVRVAPEVFDRLGATVHVIGDSPDGHNINADCGSTSPKALQAAVAEHSADVGVAFDGDADRLIAVDHRGEIIDGDHIIAIGAIDMVRRGV
jgi:phosphoglucosamine mutase